MTIFYFTGTDNSLAVAKGIAGDSGKLISIPQVIDSCTTEYKDDCIGIVFPVYGFRAPFMVTDFLNKVTLKADYIFAIATYGMIAGPTLRYVNKQLEAKGSKFNYTNKIAMVDNYLPIFEQGKQIEQLPSKNVDAQLKQIIADITERKEYNAKVSLGSRFIGKVLKPKHSTTPKKYIVKDTCTKCGVCAKVCLAKNITVDATQEPAVAFSDKCEACFACLHLCPQNALHHKKQKSELRWLNPQTSLQEIINANNRH